MPPDRATTLVLLQTDGYSTNSPAAEYVHCLVKEAIPWVWDTSKVNMAGNSESRGGRAIVDMVEVDPVVTGDRRPVLR